MKVHALTLAVALAGGFGLAHAQDSGDGLPAGPVGSGSSAANTETNAGTPANVNVPNPGRLSPLVRTSMGNAVASRVKGVVKDAFDPYQSGTFIGGIAVSDLGQAGWAGLKGDPTAKDQVDDLGHALTTPEFYAGVGMFNLVYANGERLVGQKFGMDLLSKAGADAGASTGAKVLGTAAGAAKENIVLAAALTIPRLVQFNFGGFNLLKAGEDLGSSITKPIADLNPFNFHPGNIGTDLLGGVKSFFGEASKLKNTSVSSSFKFDKQHFEDLGITLGSFILAKPLWAGIKKIGAGILEKFIARQTVAAEIEGGEVLAGGGPEDPVGDVAAVATEAGLLGWTLFDVVKGAFDLGGLLLTANAIQQPIQNWNDKRQFQDAANSAMQNYLNVTKENNGSPDPAKLQAAMSQLATAMADLRDYKYLPVAIEDAKFVSRLQNLGVSQNEINQVAQNVMQNDGAWLAAPGQTAALEDTFKVGQKQPGVSDQSALNGLIQRHDADIKDLLNGVENAPTVPTADLDPASKNFQWSGNRNQLYDQEIAILTRGGANLSSDPITIQQQQPDGSTKTVTTTRQQLVLQDMQIVGALAQAEGTLVDPAMGKTPGMTAALKGNGN
jgi:hypothetical protein